MSSPIDPAQRALRRAGLARAASWLAAALGLGLVVAFLAQAGLFSIFMSKTYTPPLSVKPDQITAVDSTVSGVDNQKQPYEVKARSGWQDSATPSLVHLDAPEGVFRRAEGAQYTIRAERGRYDTTTKALDLDGNVVLEQKERFIARMARANVLVEEKKLVSDTPVAVTFASGTVTANGMQITDDGGRILFLNGVRARFAAPQAEGDAQP
jgi:lipopolysaccharide export system protein LptC